MRRRLLLLALPGCATADLRVADPALRVAPADCDHLVPADHATVQGAIDAAADGDTICVDAGTYVENVAITGREITLAGLGPYRTVLDGGGAGTTVTVLGSTVTLDALAVTGGSTADLGGGLRVDEGPGPTTVTLTDVRIAGNVAGSGGGISAIHSTVIAEDVEIVGNEATGSGGGIYVSEAGFHGDRVLLARNVAGGGGGGGSAGRGAISLVRSHVLANVDTSTDPGGGGGGLELFTSGGPFVATVFAGNRSGAQGGAVTIGGYSGASFENVVLAANRAPKGGAVNVDGAGADADFVNVAFVRNTAADTGGVWVGTISSATFAHSDFWRNGASTNGADPVGTGGNVAVAPQFVDFSGRDALGWDFHLQPGSPLIDAGDPALVDPDGTTSDIGAYGGPEAE